MAARRHARPGARPARLALALALLAALLAGSAAALDGPECRPRTNCTLDDVNSSEEYFFTVNGRSLIIQYSESESQMRVTCHQEGADEPGPAPAADEAALPALAAPTALYLLELVGCRPPAGSYADALLALRVSSVARLWLRSVPDEPRLTRAHLSGLGALSELRLDPGTDAPRPLRPAPDFLADLRDLRSLRLFGVVAPRALPVLPATLHWLELHEVGLPVAERELRASPETAAAPHWLARLRELRGLTLVEQNAEDRLTPPPLARLLHLRKAYLRVRLGPLPPRWLNDSWLAELSLVSCGLSDLSMFPFDGTNNLTILNVSQNNLTYLPKGAFGQQEMLRRLDVSGNALSRKALEAALLPTGAGDGGRAGRARGGGAMPALRELLASHNPLGSLCKSTLIALGTASSSLPTSLTRLELRATNATRLCTDWLRESDLAVIDLRDNLIDSLDYEELAMMRRAGAAADSVQLLLTGNPLREVTVTRHQVAACPNAAKASVKPGDTTRARVELALSELHCTCNNAPLRELLQNCTLLELDGKGPGCTADNKTFLQYKPDQLVCEDQKLECPLGCKCGVMRLSDNATVVECEHAALPESWPGWAAASRTRPLALTAPGAGLTAVPHVDLVELRAPNNSITELNEADIRDTLRVLELQNNRITRVSEAAAVLLRGMDSVKLAGNPFSCTCRDQAALARLKDANVSDWNELRCGGDGALRGRLLGGLHADDLCHSMLPWLLGGMSAAAALLAGAAVALWPRIRPRIKQFLFERQLCLGWVLGVDDEVDDPEKTHDAFLSYAYPDHARAVSIVHGLERCGYSTLLHCRDWAPGPAVAEHIARSVLCARRTLLLVSDCYAGSKWALEEFRAAHAHALAARSARLLVLRCGPLAPERLPPDLRLHLHLNTYLDVDDDAFWPKLCRAMPPHRAAVAVAVERDEKPLAPALAAPVDEPPRLGTARAPPALSAAEPGDEPAQQPPARAEPGDKPMRPWPAPAPRAAAPTSAPAAAARLHRLLSPEPPAPSPVREQPAPAPRPLVAPVG